MDENEQWAFIFNVLGEETLRRVLMYVASRIEESDEPREVIEFRDGKALKVTEHVETLENKE